MPRACYRMPLLLHLHGCLSLILVVRFGSLQFHCRPIFSSLYVNARPNLIFPLAPSTYPFPSVLFCPLHLLGQGLTGKQFLPARPL